MNQAPSARGRWGEDRAAAHFQQLGFEILDRNWRSPTRAHRGEIDLIAQRDDLIVICEVKARRSSRWGGASVAVTQSKQAQVRTLTEIWLVDRAIDLDQVGIRFDVVAIDGTALTHYEAAF